MKNKVLLNEEGLTHLDAIYNLEETVKLLDAKNPMVEKMPAYVQTEMIRCSSFA